MAKTIKTIQCPNCGSVDKKNLGQGHYSCLRCDTEYFLDSDDITINHKHSFDTPNTTSVPSKKTILFGVLGFFAVTILLSVIILFWSNSSSETNSSNRGYSWGFYEKSYAYMDAKANPVQFTIGDRIEQGGMSGNKNKCVAAFFNGNTNEEINTQELNVNSATLASIDISEFDDKTIYCIINKNLLFKVDKQTNTMVELTQEFFSKNNQLVVGIAKIEFLDEQPAFNITTNDGKQLFYYPIINKTYNDKELYQAQVNDITAPNKVFQTIGFKFSGKSSSYPEEKIQLIKYQYHKSVGYPFRNPYFSWSNLSGQKVLLYAQDLHRITTIEDFTPNRNYFDPYLLDYNDSYVLISFRNAPTDKAPISLQLLEAKTAKIVCTVPCNEVNFAPKARLLQKGFFTFSNTAVIYYDFKGKKISSYEK